MTENSTPTPEDVQHVVSPDPAPERAEKFKTVAKVAVGTSVRFVIAGTLSHVVPTESKKDKLKLALGTYVISGAVSEVCKAYAVDRIDYYLGVTDELKVMRLNYLLSQQTKNQTDTPTP